jgi:hypothetical protein
MILASNGIIASSISGVDADYLAFYNRVIAAGGSLNATEQSATNQLVLSLKANGIWNSCLAIYPMVGASAAACAQNLKSSSFTGVFTSGWTFASTGATPNGTSAYMNTNFNPNGILTTSSGHYTYYSRTNVNGLHSELGGDSSGNQHSLNIYSGEFYPVYKALAGAFLSIVVANSQGFWLVNRNSATNTQGFRNGSQLINGAQTAGVPNANIYIGALNNNGTPIQFTTKQCAFSSIGDGMTNTQASNYYTVVQSFQTSLSRNV